MMDKNIKTGFIGVGLMGHGMARNIVEKGWPLAVLGHRNRQPVEDLKGRGATEARNAAELARDCDLVFICVTGTPQVEENVFGENGILAGITPGTIVADCSTTVPESTRKVAAAIEAKGGRFLDLPLNRTPVQAEEGTLAVMYGGDPALFDAIKPVVECFADSFTHCGETGSAIAIKLVNNFLALGTAILANEAMAVARKVGIDKQVMYDVITSGGADSVMFRRMAQNALEDDDTAFQFTIRNMHKDLTYYTRMAESLPAIASMAETARQTVTLARVAGDENAFGPRIYDVLCKLNGAANA
jgi:3-hydroxyisobutyrate dehydrogenase-like beta-hydroxyacid dehydrogenase